MDIRILLVCLPGDPREIYLENLKKLDIKIDVIETYGEIYEQMVSTAYSCIMVDMLTRIRCAKHETSTIHTIFNTFPTILLKCDPKTKNIHTTYYAHPQDAGTTEEFIQHACKTFTARRIRSSERKDIHFNVLLGKTSKIQESTATKSVTLNVSNGGCFIFSIERWNPEEETWFIFKELSDQTPIGGKVQWTATWGQAMKIPGIGIQLFSLSGKQAKEIDKIYKNFQKVTSLI